MPADFITLPLIVLAWCVMLGTFNFLGWRNLSYLAVGRIGAARAGAIVGTSAVFASILAITITGERPHWIVLVGTVVVVAGLATALGKNIMETATAGNRVRAGGSPSSGTCWPSARPAVTDDQRGGATTDDRLHVAAGGRHHQPVLRGTAGGPGGGEAGVGVREGGEAVAGLHGVRRAVGTGGGHRGQLHLLRAATGRGGCGGPIVSAEPPVHAVAGSLFLQQQETVNRWLVLGIVVTVAGVALVVLGSTL